MTKQAKVRVCASCEWIFRWKGGPECPKCGFGSYGARFVYGDAAYRYLLTQKPWKEKKLNEYIDELNSVIEKHAEVERKGKSRTRLQNLLDRW